MFLLGQDICSKNTCPAEGESPRPSFKQNFALFPSIICCDHDENLAEKKRVWGLPNVLVFGIN